MSTPASPSRLNFGRAIPLILMVAFFQIAWPLQGLAQQGNQAPLVSIIKPLEKEVTEWDEYTGRFRAVKSVEIRARVTGYLESIHFTDGQYVDKGDLLFVIDPRPFEAAVELAQANVARFESELELADLELKRAERLLPNRNIAREEYDSRVANKKVRQAQLRAAIAELRSAELELEFTQVRAPISGRVSSAEVDEGNLIESASASSPSLTTIVSQAPIYFVFDVSEADYLKYIRLRNRTGNSGPTEQDSSLAVELRLMDETDWTRQGKLDFVDNVFDRSSGTLRLRATFPNPDAILVPGLFGRLRLPATEPALSLMIPEIAVLSDQSRKIVMIVDAEGMVQPRPVVLGPRQESLIAVKKGLSKDDQVIVKGLLRARPGSKVSPQTVTLEELQQSMGGAQ